MSYTIAKEITITPNKIVFVGHSNNVFPKYDSSWEVPFDWQHLRWLVNDLVGRTIQPTQLWWKTKADYFAKKYDYNDVCRNDEIAEDAMKLLVELYNLRLTEKYQYYVQNDTQYQIPLLTFPNKTNDTN